MLIAGMLVGCAIMFLGVILGAALVTGAFKNGEEGRE